MVLTCCIFPPKGSLSVSQLQQVERCVNDIISVNQIVQEYQRTEDSGRGELRSTDSVSLSPA